MTHDEEQRELFKIASNKLGPAIGELADKIVSVKTGFVEFHAAIARIKKDLEKKQSKKDVWAVECRGDDDIYLFIAASFAEVHKKVSSLPDWPKTLPATKKKRGS